MFEIVQETAGAVIAHRLYYTVYSCFSNGDDWSEFLLCQMIADATKLDIVAGPFEATAYGNILIQKIALNEIKSLEEGFNIIENHQKYINIKQINIRREQI